MFSRNLPLLSGRPVVPCPFSGIALPFGQSRRQSQHSPRFHIPNFCIPPGFRLSGYHREKNGRHLFRSNRPVTVHQVAEPCMVIPTAIVPIRTTATLQADDGFHFRTEAHRDSHTVLVMIDEELPDRSPLPAPCGIQGSHPPILPVRQVVVPGIIGSHIFGRPGHHHFPGLAAHQRVCQVTESIIPLIIGRLQSIRKQAESRHRMPLVAPALLHLVQIAQRAAFILVEPRHKPPTVTAHPFGILIGVGRCHAERLIARPFLQPIHTIVINVGQVAQHAQRHTEQGITQPPVAVVMIPVPFTHHRVVTTFQEVLRHSEPHVYHVLLEQFEILTFPFRVVTHDFRRIDQLITVKSRNQGYVRVTPQSLVIHAISIQHIDGDVAIALVTGNLPQKGALVGPGGIAVTVHIIVSGHTADNHLVHGPVMAMVATHGGRGAQSLQRLKRMGIARSDSGLHGFEIRFGVQQPRMTERLALSKQRADCQCSTEPTQ